MYDIFGKDGQQSMISKTTCTHIREVIQMLTVISRHWAGHQAEFDDCQGPARDREHLARHS
jgi:hypothetical protein